MNRLCELSSSHDAICLSEPAAITLPPERAVTAEQAVYANNDALIIPENHKAYQEIKGLVRTLPRSDTESVNRLYSNILSALTGQPVDRIVPGAITKALDEAKGKNPSEQQEVLKQVKNLLDRCVQANKADPIYQNVDASKTITVKDVLKVFKDGKRGLKLNSKEVKDLESRAQAKIGSSNQNIFGSASKG